MSKIICLQFYLVYRPLTLSPFLFPQGIDCTYC